MGVCAVCGLKGAVTVDHIIARGFFPKEGEYRSGLPCVNLCYPCNNKKSQIENRLAILMQFAGDSPAAKSMFESGRIERMLAENLKFKRMIGRNLMIDHKIDRNSILRPITRIRLEAGNIEDISIWLKMLFMEFYYLWKSESICKNVAMTCINPPSDEMHSYLDSMIESTQDIYSIGNFNQGWHVKIAKSPDNLMLFQFHFNGITQYVAASCDPNSSVIRQYSKVGY